MKKHINVKLASLLSLSDEELEAMFQQPAEHLRKEFMGNMADGDIYCPVEGCEGWSAITGCPGHVDTACPKCNAGAFNGKHCYDCGHGFININELKNQR